MFFVSSSNYNYSKVIELTAKACIVEVWNVPEVPLLVSVLTEPSCTLTEERKAIVFMLPKRNGGVGNYRFVCFQLWF